MTRIERLGRILESVYREFNRRELVAYDPLRCVHAQSQNRDREIVGLLASCLAYGRRDKIIEAVTECRHRMGDGTVVDFIADSSYTEKKRLFRNFTYRFNTGNDIALLLQTTGRILRRYGSIEAFFSNCSDTAGGDAALRLDAFSAGFLSHACCIEKSIPRSFAYLFPSPRNGSACKRANLYFRWMVRGCDGIDCGIWESASPETLVIPLDVHIARAARFLGICSRSQADWKTAQLITQQLKRVCTHDPVRYDFSLCQFGMLVQTNSNKAKRLCQIKN